jgi:type IV pilus assembly protein PilY1
MKRFKYTLKSAGIGLLISMYGSVPVMADDIEIYTSLGSGAIAVKPNVLFILDNSGSMSSNTVPNIKQRFNASGSYTGCFDASKVYYSVDGNRPVCGSADYFALSDLHCDHANDEYNSSGTQISSDGPLEVWGTYADQLSQHSSTNVWGTITVTNRPVECAQDQGIHGSNANPTARRYIVNDATGWQTGATSLPVWSGGKNNYTIYHGNYLNYLMDATVPDLATAPTRFAEVVRAINALIDTNTSINVGLLAFDEFTGWPVDSGTTKIDGGAVLFPMEDVNAGRTGFKSALGDINANTGTPLAEAYYEALRYYGGMSVHYGVDSTPPSVAASQSGGSYISPITNECQKHSIIVLTDGLPSEDNLTTGELGQLPGYTDMSCAVTAARPPADPNCLDELAEWALTHDVLAGSGPVEKGTQTITTHTVGFANASLSDPGTLIVNTAAAGGGQFVTADNADTLRNEISKLFAAELEVNTTFSSPAVSVNAFNRSTHLDDLYFTLFEPANTTHWAGNFKKYKLDFFVDSTDLDSDGDVTERLPFIKDATGANAVDPGTGFFKNQPTPAKSFWSATADGAEVSAGGAAAELTNSRNVYTFTDTYSNSNGVFTPGAASAALTASSNAVDKTNTAITDVMLDIVGQPDKIAGTPRIETLLDWAAGIDVLDQFGTAGTTTDARLEMGDPLHSEPALVQHGTETVSNLVAYVATNDGYLHAFDVNNGQELFSFIPQELLPNLNDVMDNSSGIKTYGLDGNVVAWINDADGDGEISGAGEHVYLYIGMRRGGKNIYSLDVTDPTMPSLRWVIKGGSGDYAELAQTWSTVNVEKIKDGTTEKTVLIFGGGYDVDQDNATVRTADDDGNAIFIADADSGQLLWSAGNGGTQAVADMDYSIPARVKPLDLKGDGLIDRLYVADTGGQIFRFDIDNDNGAALASSITGGRIADLADSSTEDARRFYYPPDVALIAKRGEPAYLALAIASGYRAHPLNTEIQDRIYLLKDKDVYNVPSSYTTLTESDLFDVTLNLVAGDSGAFGDATADAARQTELDAIDAADGWYIKLDDGTDSDTWLGEKGLSEALLIEGVAVVSTYIPTPPSVSTASCIPPEGNGRVFYLDVFDGSAAFPSNLDLRIDRQKELVRGGIPPSPNVIITKGGEPTLCIGTECEAAGFGLGARKTYWYEVEN